MNQFLEKNQQHNPKIKIPLKITRSRHEITLTTTVLFFIARPLNWSLKLFFKNSCYKKNKLNHRHPLLFLAKEGDTEVSQKNRNRNVKSWCYVVSLKLLWFKPIFPLYTTQKKWVRKSFKFLFLPSSNIFLAAFFLKWKVLLQSGNQNEEGSFSLHVFLLFHPWF